MHSIMSVMNGVSYYCECIGQCGKNEIPEFRAMGMERCLEQDHYLVPRKGGLFLIHDKASLAACTYVLPSRMDEDSLKNCIYGQ